MQVILLQRIGRLGQMGDVVNVKDGFARNFLLPQKKALRATEENRKHFESQRQPQMVSKPQTPLGRRCPSSGSSGSCSIPSIPISAVVLSKLTSRRSKSLMCRRCRPGW